MTSKSTATAAALATLIGSAAARGRNWMRSDECIGVATHCGCCGRPLKDAFSVQVACGPDCRERYGFENVPSNPDWYAAKNIAIHNGVEEDAVSDWTDARVVCNLFLHVYALDAEHQPWCVDAVESLGYTGLSKRMTQRRDEFIARAKKRAEKEAALAAKRAAAAKRAGRKWGNSYTNTGAVTAPVRAPEPREVRITVETVTDTYRGKTTSREVLTVKAPFNAVFNALPVPGRWFDRNAKVWRVPVANKPALWTAVQAAFKGLPLVSAKGTTTIA